MRSLLRSVPASFWKFALVGACGLVVDVAVLYLCIAGFDLNRLLARVPSYLAAATFTWGMNRWLTFGPSGRPLIAEWASFIATNLVGQALNMGVYAVALLVLPAAWWAPGAGAVAGSLAGLLLNYQTSRAVVFRKAA